MKDMTLERIAACCGGTYHGSKEAEKQEVTGIAIDSRKVTKGGLFIPICGERVDGHSFIPQVMEQGALCALSEHPLEEAYQPYIEVASTTDALKKIAACYRQILGIPVVGITGSVGKTSTKEMIASVLGEKYHVHKTAGNFNNEIGLPLTVFGLTEEHEAAVLEMGISDFGEMHRLAEIANPDICVITNIGQCHLENLGTRDGILRAKTEVFAHLRGPKTVILNGDDDKLSTVTEVEGKAPILYTKTEDTRENVHAYASDIVPLGMEGIRMTLHLYGESQTVTIPIPGEHNIYNALAAACVGHAMQMTLPQICLGIEKVQTISGRSNLLHFGSVTVMDDCYNANPVSMKASLDVLGQAAGRKVAVLGDMGELGSRERELHAEAGAYAAKKTDLLLCAGKLSEEMAHAAEDPGCEVHHYDTREELTEALLTMIKPQDTILVKASHFMEYPKVVEALRHHFESGASQE